MKKIFVSDNPLLMGEWNWERNIEMGYSPDSISYGSAQKVWWKCSKGHEWKASPNHRSRGRGCPECAQINSAINRRKNAVARRGSLAENNSELARQWHPTKNKELTPFDVTVNCPEKVWWRCEKGHEWQAAINSRNSGAGCPICSGHKLVVGINDLATVRPDLAAQWHPTKNGNMKPTDVIAGTDKNVWWKCEKGHEWQARINNRVNGNNCPICIGKKVLVGYNDLETVRPELAKEWHPTKNGALTPQDVVAGSNKKVWWQCKNGHEWKTAISHRGLRGTGCPICSGENGTSFPEQAIFFYFCQVTAAYNRYMVDTKTEIDVYLPEYKIGIEYDGAYFHKGAEAEQREKRKQKKLDKLGILLVRVREMESQLDEHTVYSKPGASDAELTQTIKELLSHVSKAANASFSVDVDVARDRSRIYERYVQGEKENSLLIKNPVLASEWHPTKNGKLLPEMVTPSSNKKVWWQCEKGHEWEAVINSRNQGAGCPYCSGLKAIVGYNDLETVNPELASQWHPTKNGALTPQDVTVGSNKKVWWQCEKGHEWKTEISHRGLRGTGCPICSGHKILAGYNDLETVNPSLAAEWHPTKNGKLLARDVTAGSDKKVWWKCSKGHEWEATISSRSAGRGCPYCASQKLLVGFNDLQTRNPKLASEWHPTKNGSLTPKDVMPGTNKKVWWLCEKGHEWENSINVRNGGNGCPYCANQMVLKGYNDLSTLKPNLASEWHPTKNGNLTPSDVMPGSNKKAWWLCENGHEWEALISSRNKGAGCPKCAIKRRSEARRKNKN